MAILLRTLPLITLECDDSLISGTPNALKHLQQQLQKHFKCKFVKPKDFLGLDLTHAMRHVVGRPVDKADGVKTMVELLALD